MGWGGGGGQGEAEGGTSADCTSVRFTLYRSTAALKTVFLYSVVRLSHVTITVQFPAIFEIRFEANQIFDLIDFEINQTES